MSVESRATGIILRTRPLTETSLIVHWLTADCGRVATVAKGARRPKSPFRGKLDLFYECDFTFARSRRSELHALREARLIESHSALRRTMGWLEQAAYAAALIEQTTETETPLPGFLELMTSFLCHLPGQAPQPRTVFAFELRLLQELGLLPDPAVLPLTSGSRELVTGLALLEWSALGALKPTAIQVRELDTWLRDFLLHHLGRIPPGRDGAVGGG